MYIFIELFSNQRRILVGSDMEKKNMRSILLYAKIDGFKCIKEPVEIQFANKTLDDKLFERPLVKAIYGSNGTGKSAIVYAFDVYRKTIIDSTFLAVENATGNLKDMINQTTKCATVDLFFAVKTIQTAKGRVFHHTLKYFLKDGEVVLGYEKLSHVKGQFWSSEQSEETIYEVENGEIKEILIDDEGIKQDIIDKSKNLLSTNSLLNKALDVLNSNSDIDKKCPQFSLYVISAYIFIFSLIIFIDEKDSNKMTIAKANATIKSLNRLEKSGIKNVKEFVVDDEVDEVLIKNFDAYKKEVDSIAKFLKIFKPNLKKIEIQKDVMSSEKYLCKKVLVYVDGSRIDSKYESNGIKKLMKLFPLLSTSNIFGILIIDEMDSNIHDVYLCKLIEYFAYYSQCQLIFTTHNLGPMEVLDNTKLKYSIDFVNNSKITSWKKNGNYSVVNVYRSGAIPNCPFNINAADFVKVIGE